MISKIARMDPYQQQVMREMYYGSKLGKMGEPGSTWHPDYDYCKNPEKLLQEGDALVKNGTPKQRMAYGKRYNKCLDLYKGTVGSYNGAVSRMLDEDAGLYDPIANAADKARYTPRRGLKRTLESAREQEKILNETMPRVAKGIEDRLYLPKINRFLK